MVCIDFQPFSIVENKGFLRLLKHIEPRYTAPSIKTLSNTILKDMYSEVTNYVKCELGAAQCVAITTDMWISMAKNDFYQTYYKLDALQTNPAFKFGCFTFYRVK